MRFSSQEALPYGNMNGYLLITSGFIHQWAYKRHCSLNNFFLITAFNYFAPKCSSCKYCFNHFELLLAKWLMRFGIENLGSDPLENIRLIICQYWSLTNATVIPSFSEMIFKTLRNEGFDAFVFEFCCTTAVRSTWSIISFDRDVGSVELVHFYEFIYSFCSF